MIIVSERYGRLDVLINNVGVYLNVNEKLLIMDFFILEKMMRINFFGVYYVIYFFILFMEK